MLWSTNVALSGVVGREIPAAVLFVACQAIAAVMGAVVECMCVVLAIVEWVSLPSDKFISNIYILKSHNSKVSYCYNTNGQPCTRGTIR